MSKRIGMIFLGPPGSGKGTQAQRLSSTLHIPHISTGEILRAAIVEATPLGRRAKTYVENGDLVPDDLLLDLVRERLGREDAGGGWILDGFPRTVSQATFLDALLEESPGTAPYAVDLEVPDEVLIGRLLLRGRQDDTTETIRHRLEVYHRQTAPLREHYRQRGALHSIDGNRPLDAVTDSLRAIVAP